VLDSHALRNHLGFLRDGGLDGVLVMGTNGEFPSFDIDERLLLAEAAVEFSEGLQLMLGVGSCALPECIRLVRAGAELGFGSLLLPPPFYFRSAPVAGMIGFVAAVLDAAELPVLLYHIPQVTGVPITDGLLDAVRTHPSFGGVKDSTGELAELERLVNRVGNGVYMVGHDRLVAASVSRGGGSISAAASVAPALVAAVQRRTERQPELDAVRSLLESHGLGPAVKAILRSMGFGSYRSRPPLVGLDEASAARLLDEFRALVFA
jgi:4-hydroxy-tetrahydrodipicolinate synthase